MQVARFFYQSPGEVLVLITNNFIYNFVYFLINKIVFLTLLH